MRTVPCGRIIGSICGLLSVPSTAALLFAVAIMPSPARAAMEFEVEFKSGAAEMHHPYGVAADALGNVYIADTSNHRVLKFDKRGTFRRLFGSLGSGNAQLYYPEGVTVGEHSSGETRIYIADTANSRVMIFDTGGRYVGKFGSLGSGDDHLNYPGGIAFLQHEPPGSGGDVIVADTRNRRVSVFDENGSPKARYHCSTCPGGQFITPTGVAARRKPGGGLELYAVDMHAGRVHVLNGKGNWLRSFGGPGTAEGQLAFPDDVAVDPDGSSYVAESGVGADRISKFGQGGTFLYAFSTSGPSAFVQPHGVALDRTGRVHVANSGASEAYRFQERAPEIVSGPVRANAYWARTEGAWYTYWYNGVEQTCNGRFAVTIRVPRPGADPIFTLEAGPVTFTAVRQLLKIDMSTQQARWVKQAADAAKPIHVATRVRARCEDGARLAEDYADEKH